MAEVGCSGGDWYRGESMKPREAADATPAGRDRVIDFVRAASLAVVILGHWLMAAVTESGIRGRNVLAELPSLQPLTWLFQVMPLFFVAGGFANLISWRGVQRRGGGYADYAHARVSRLVRPALLFATAVPLLLSAAALAGLGPDLTAAVGELLGRPLWFLGVYVLATALAPALAAWHAHGRVAALATLGVLATVTDVIRFGYEPAGYLNFGFVWLFAQQLGFWYADGRLSRLSRRVLWSCVAAAIGLLLILTGPGPYPLSMVGLPGEMSNMAPPTVCLLVLVAGQVAGLMLARPVLAAWLDRARPWFTVVLVGSMAMTLYLWHLPVLVVGFTVLLWLDVPLPPAGTAEWWLSRPVWCALLAVLLAALAARLARFERYGVNRERAVSGDPGPAGDNGTLLAGAGTLAAAAGLFGLVIGGLTPSLSVAVSLAALACGLALTTRSTRGTPTCGYTLGGYGVPYQSNKTARRPHDHEHIPSPGHDVRALRQRGQFRDPPAVRSLGRRGRPR
jgi:fucose 4-O-acetylase-like acetyltransferase